LNSLQLVFYSCIVVVEADPVQNVTLSNEGRNDSNYLLTWSHSLLCHLIFRISYWRRGNNDIQVCSSVWSTYNVTTANFNFY